MRSDFDLLTPYRRVCGAMLLVLVSVVGPNVGFAASIALSPTSAGFVYWALYGACAAIALLPAVRRVSEGTSWLFLVGSVVVIIAGYSFDSNVKEELARAAGMFDAPAAWRDAPSEVSSLVYEHPSAHYTMRIPSDWEQEAGPMRNLHQFVRHRGDTVTTILRPSCEVDDEPLSVTVRKLEQQWPELRRTCSHWHGLNCCLLQRPSNKPGEVMWLWLARAPGSTRSISLLFLIDDIDNARVTQDLYAILNSVKPAPSESAGMPCPVPLEWATPF
ncbi:MAG: hypothetical protein JWN04_1602 [Myxococcaceae bacterium]|nr:hypothetical protein [Myxococcaceae bacterium]